MAPKLAAFRDEIFHNGALFDRIRAVYEAREAATLPDSARAALEAQLRKEERRLARREARAALAATPEAKVKRLEASLLRRGAL